MMAACTDVSAVEHQLVTERLRRLARAEALSADEGELDGLASLLLVPEDAELALQLLSEVLAEAAGGCA
jgi:hypothetical protein